LRAFSKPGLRTLVYVLNDRVNDHEHRRYDFQQQCNHNSLLGLGLAVFEAPQGRNDGRHRGREF
ncbi:hypothetical protein ACP3P6_04370, partial [Enterobacter mori]